MAAGLQATEAQIWQVPVLKDWHGSLGPSCKRDRETERETESDRVTEREKQRGRERQRDLEIYWLQVAGEGLGTMEKEKRIDAKQAALLWCFINNDPWPKREKTELTEKLYFWVLLKEMANVGEERAPVIEHVWRMCKGLIFIPGISSISPASAELDISIHVPCAAYSPDLSTEQSKHTAVRVALAHSSTTV